MNTPALITQAPRGNPAIVGQGGEVIFGGSNMLDEIRDGGRLRAGMWLDECRTWAVQAEYLGLARVAEGTCQASGGSDRTVARPFINALTGQPTTELIGYLPSVGKSLSGSGAVCGAVHAELDSEFQGAGFWLRHNYSSSLDCTGNGYRLDTLLGYRFLKLDESVGIREGLTSLDPSVPNTAFDILDQFGTRNEFNGLDLGLLWNGRWNRWSLDILGKVALGNNQQVVNINGCTWLTDTASGRTLQSTVAVPADGAGVGEYTGGGLLAQRPNIGEHKNNQFVVVPELGLTLGYAVNDHVRATFGYTLLVLPKAVRPGDQIDPYVNPAYLPDELYPLPAPARPALTMREDTFWVQGLNAGLEFAW